MKTSPQAKPAVGGMGGSVHDWERCKDPFHRDAAPEEFQEQFTQGVRVEGWMALDAFGNGIGFVPDGTELK